MWTKGGPAPRPDRGDADAARQRLVEALVATGEEDRSAFRTLFTI